MNRKILNIAVPAIISNITVPLLGLVDIAITGHLGKTAYIGAIALGTLFFNILYWNFGFLRMGTSGITAQAYGKGDNRLMVQILVQAIGVGLIAAALILLLQSPIKKIAFMLLDPSAEIQHHALTYINILIWGVPAMLVLFGFYGWFIGMQNSRYQMYIAVSMNVVNIAFSFLFVYGFDLKIEGVAWGTLISNYVGVLIAIALWMKKYGYLKIFFEIKNSMQLSRMKEFFSVNRDIYLRTLCLIAVTTFFTYSGTQQGEVTLAVNALLMQLFTLFSYFMDGFAYAGEALVGRYIGENNKQSLKSAVKSLFVWGVSLAGVFTLLYTVGGTNFLQLLTDDKDVIAASSSYFYWVLAIPLAGFAAFVWDGVYIGATQTRYMLYGVGGASVVFFAIVYFFSGLTNNHVLWFAFIIYLVLRGLIQTLFASKVFDKA